MAKFTFNMPDIGEGIAEAEIVAWHVAVGDRVEEDQNIADMMTDKATVEMESPVSGVVVELAGEVGDQVAIGAALVVIETEDAGAEDAGGEVVAAPATAEQIAAGASIEASIEDALASAVRELGAGEGAEKEGVLSSGARWWREEGEDKLEGGKVMSWTCIRGTSADGAVEWEERWWKTSDSFTYRELGAVKSGRDSNGQAWQESWKEMYVHEVNKIPYIHRGASKWSHTP